MADRIAYQDGNWTGATTWKGVATGSGAKQATITASTNTTTTNVASSNFTIGNGTVVEGLLLHCAQNTTTGTVTVGLYDGTTLLREVVVNATDLPIRQSWVFFKFATTYTANNNSTFNVRVRGSSTSNAVFYRDATAGNWARYLRTNTTATIAATDVTFICDELTAAATKTDITVTMDSTASTAYGECNIGQGGVLSYGTAASTNYILDLAGDLNIWGGGTFNIGTSGARIPSTSTALLEFTVTTAGQFGLLPRTGGTLNVYGAVKSNTKVLLTADAAAGQRVVTVEATSGWAANDELGIASTGRAAAGQSEKVVISTVDSATQITTTANLVNLHHGVAPYQAEVINLTRNVKIRGTSISLTSYINPQGSSTVNIEYAEITWIGGTSPKQGFETSQNASQGGSSSVTFCSFHNIGTGGQAFANGTNASATFADNVVLSVAGLMNISATSGVITAERNWLLGSSAFNLNIADAGSIFNDNRVVGHQVQYSENALINSCSGNVVHSNNASGISLGYTYGTINNLTAWRNNDYGLNIGGTDVTVTNCNFYHNRVGGIGLQSASGYANAGTYVSGTTFNGGTGASLAASFYHIAFGQGGRSLFDNCTFGNLQVAGTAAFQFPGAQWNAEAIVRRSTIADTTITVSQTNMSRSTRIPAVLGFDKFNNTAGSHRFYRAAGYCATEQTIFRTAAPSEAMLPSLSTSKLQGGSKRFAVASGTTATVTVYVYKSATYNGAQPRLIVKENGIAGISSDTVLATASGGTGSWLTLTGTTATVSDDCVLEVFVDCDGTAGTVYVDDWSVT